MNKEFKCSITNEICDGTGPCAYIGHEDCPVPIPTSKEERLAKKEIEWCRYAASINQMNEEGCVTCKCNECPDHWSNKVIPGGKPQGPYDHCDIRSMANCKACSDENCKLRLIASD